MILKIEDDFVEQGLTLEEAFILARVQYYEDEETPCIESNLTIAKMIGKSESTTRRAIESLIEKGYLNRSIVRKTRILSINGVHNEQVNEQHVETKKKEKSPLDGLTAEEKARRLQELINETRDPNFDITEELY